MQNILLSRWNPVSRPGDRRPATREMVHARTHELAEHAGRIPPYVEQADYEQAKRELTGETDSDRQLAILDADLSAASGSSNGHRQTELQPALAQ